ncbi:hypothetical protein FE784_23470 [Paenibacillus hemerocallicola]|jgi:hypothetical protein|uniref:Uncharacterized protein n=1 Tax=Paenibacillus hemerocallicola TaxID=1172614 RepID=A0A5C4T6I8_9BACL|nr:hypothetical protein [Paenibacillus hemerocallicola]TNJ63839.1 hypothetical protein FE784_23470 [Paenibacillus hemerocallicola]
MAKYRNVSLVLIIATLVLVVCLQFSVFQRAAARFTASTYIAFNYRSIDLTFQTIEYSPQFGSYFVKYRDQEGQNVGFEVKSKRLPIVVVFDPLNPGA